MTRPYGLAATVSIVSLAAAAHMSRRSLAVLDGWKHALLRSMTVVLAFAAAHAATPSYVLADTNIIRGTTGADTMVYGDILRVYYPGGSPYLTCENLGPGVCRWDYAASSPYRGTYRALEFWDGSGFHESWGEPSGANSWGSDYIYPANEFDSYPIGCASTYYVATSGNWSTYFGCESGTAVANFQAQVRIHGDSSVSYQGAGDHIWGFNYYDQLYGNGGGDTVYGGATYDDIFGQDGNDYLYPETLSSDYEYVEGGNGADRIYGADNISYPDVIYGGAGDDIIWGYAGNDDLFGEAGADVLFGGNGANDELWGGADNDCLSDTAVYRCDCDGGANDQEDCDGTDGTDCENHVSMCIIAGGESGAESGVESGVEPGGEPGAGEE